MRTEDMQLLAWLKGAQVVQRGKQQVLHAFILREVLTPLLRLQATAGGRLREAGLPSAAAACGAHVALSSQSRACWSCSTRDEQLTWEQLSSLCTRKPSVSLLAMSVAGLLTLENNSS